MADRLDLPLGQPAAHRTADPGRAGPAAPAPDRSAACCSPTSRRCRSGRRTARFLYDGLLDYARAHPERQVRLRPRHRLGEDTFHRMRHHPESLLADVDLPPNFGISHTPIAEQLADTDLLLTVSSTACLEALEAGCRVALPLDLGVHEKLGNHVFLDSGLLRTFDQIIADDLGAPEPDWLADYLLAEPTAPAVIIARPDRGAARAAASGRRRRYDGPATTGPRRPSTGLWSDRGSVARSGPDPDLGSGRLAAADGGRQPRCAAAGARPAGPPARLQHGRLALTAGCAEPHSAWPARLFSSTPGGPGSAGRDRGRGGPSARSTLGFRLLACH